MTYFDHNATSPMLPEARRVWLEAVEQFIGNPSSPHRVGARAEAALNEARERLAKMLGCDAFDLVWTSGATESANWVLHHLLRSSPPGAECWVSAIEHPCVLETARHHFGSRLRLVPVTPGGVVQVDGLRERLRRKPPALLAVMAANNETGVLQPWRELAALCGESGVPFLCDATQWLGRLPAARLGVCDFLIGSAHKFGGPRGVGFLKCPARGRVEPLLWGGRQEEGRRAGTENVPGVLAMVGALETRNAECQRRPGESLAHRRAVREAFEQQLQTELPGAEIVGAGQERLWNTVSALMPETDCRRRWVVKLDKRGFAVSTGSACSSGREEPSHVLRAMGYSGSQAGRALRFSAGWETTEADWSALLAALAAVHRGL